MRGFAGFLALLLLSSALAASTPSSAEDGPLREWALSQVPIPSLDYPYYTAQVFLGMDQQETSYVFASWFVGVAEGCDGDAEVTTFDTLDIDPERCETTVDLGGAYHLVYEDGLHRIVYASNSNGTWAQTVVDDVSMIGGGWAYVPVPRIAVDGGGGAHLCYHSMDDGHELRYANNVMGTWTVEDIPGALNSSSVYSIAVGSDGMPRIAYYNYNTSELRSAVKSGSTWTVRNVDDRYRVTSAAVCLDAEDSMRIAYTTYEEVVTYPANTPEGVYVAAEADGEWAVTEVVSDDVRSLRGVSAGIDSHGNMHVSYYEDHDMDLKYATDEGGAWTTDTVDAVDHVGVASSLRVDSEDRIHIAYYNDTSKSVNYAIGTAIEASPDTEGGSDPFILVATVTAVATAAAVVAIVRWPRT